MEKTELVQKILEKLRHDLSVIVEAREMANEEAMPDGEGFDSQRENHALENQFLVDGQSRIVNDLKDAITAYDSLSLRAFGPDEPIALSALVRVKTGGETSLYFLGPKAGGAELETDAGLVFVLTPQSPLGRRLIGQKAGATVAVGDGAKAGTAEIVSVK